MSVPVPGTDVEVPGVPLDVPGELLAIVGDGIGAGGVLGVPAAPPPAGLPVVAGGLLDGPEPGAEAPAGPDAAAPDDDALADEPRPLPPGAPSEASSANEPSPPPLDMTGELLDPTVMPDMDDIVRSEGVIAVCSSAPPSKRPSPPALPDIPGSRIFPSVSLPSMILVRAGTDTVAPSTVSTGDVADIVSPPARAATTSWTRSTTMDSPDVGGRWSDDGAVTDALVCGIRLLGAIHTSATTKRIIEIPTTTTTAVGRSSDSSLRDM